MGHHRSATVPSYDADFFAWTQHQAKLLRTLNRWRPDLPTGLDLNQVAEEIQELGSAELSSVKSLIRQMLVHLIKAASEPGSTAIARSCHAHAPGGTASPARAGSDHRTGYPMRYSRNTLVRPLPASPQWALRYLL